MGTEHARQELADQGRMDALPLHAHWVRVPRFFGDAVMIHAAIAPLRAAGLPLVLWGPGWVVDLFAGSEDYAAVYAEPQRKYSPWKASRMLRAHRPASVINFPKSHRPMMAAWLARVPLRLGCGDGGGSLFYTHSIAFYKQDNSFVARYGSVVRRAFPHLPEPDFRPFRPRAEAMAQVAQESVGLGPYIVFAPGANSHSKRLPVATFIELGRRLEAEGYRVVVVGGAGDDQRLAAEICQPLTSAVDVTGKGGLAYSAAWICGAAGLVGVDSGLAHVAGIAGIPTVALYGPTRPQHSSPWGPKVKALRVEGLDCLECMEWTCPKADHPCMRGLGADALLGALKGLLA